MIAPKVLVLLAARDGHAWIAEQIESILCQVNVDVTIVISDDGSRDGTRALLEGMRNKRLRIISPPVPTGSAAGNFLWLISNVPADGFEFVSLADQDDVWHEEKLSRACSAISDVSAAAYSCAVTAFWNNGRESLLVPSPRPTDSDFFFESAGQGCTYVLTCEFYRLIQKYFRKHAPMTENLHYHDWAIYALSRSWKLSWVFDRQSFVRYRQHKHNDTGARASAGGIFKRIALMRNGWYVRQIRVITNICISAAPGDPVIRLWRDLLVLPSGAVRQLRITRFCLSGGRRRRAHNIILLGAVILGWI